MSLNDSSPRPPAALSAALLARKGAARPAGFAATTVAAPRSPSARAPRSHDAICSDASAGGTEGRARLTLRLDETRHLRLKLTSAHLQRSLQEILTEALDRYLDQVSPEMLSSNCMCLAARVRNAGS